MPIKSMDFFKDIINFASGKSFYEVSTYIYKEYSNSSTQSNSIPSKIIKSSIIFDKGWFYNNKSESYFKKINKYLLKKGTEYVTVNPDEFIYDFENSEHGYRFVKIQIKKYETIGNWNWINGNHYLGFTNRNRYYFSFKLEKGLNAKIIRFLKKIAFQLNKFEIAFKLKYVYIPVKVGHLFRFKVGQRFRFKVVHFGRAYWC